MRIEETHIAGVRILHLDSFQDPRGSFSRAFCHNTFQTLGLPKDLVQWNISTNPHEGTLRGLHWQNDTAPEDKLIHCVGGRIWDVVVDMRPNSPTIGQHFGLELSESTPIALQIPHGCAHGFLTLEPNSTVLYGVTGAYTPAAEMGARWDDPNLNIDWPVRPKVLSDKDAGWKDITL